MQGFDGRPPALESMDPLLDLGMSGNAKMAKKAGKFQRGFSWFFYGFMEVFWFFDFYGVFNLGFYFKGRVLKVFLGF